MDWAVTGIFYAALHYIEVFLATQSVHSPAHCSRETLFRRFPQLNPIYSEYRTLKDDSEGARYRLEAFTAHEVQAFWTMSWQLSSVSFHTPEQLFQEGGSRWPT
jgi:hypothetical protein